MATSIDDASPTTAPGSGAVYDGPRWHRARIRTWGPFVALLLPGLIGAIAWLSLRLFDTASSGAVGLVGGVLAAPALLAVGAPFGDRATYPFAVAGSMLIWLAIGFVAARRATRHPFATWGDFWKHYLTLLAGVWVGVCAALVIVTVRLGESLF